MKGNEEADGSERTWESRRRALSRVFLLVFHELPKSEGGGRWSVNYQPVLGTGMGSTPASRRRRLHHHCRRAARQGARPTDRGGSGGGRVRDNVFNYLQDVT